MHCRVAGCNRGQSCSEEIAPVETVRLRKLQGLQVERLLEAYISRSNMLPKGSYQIRDPGSVPQGLQRVLGQATEQGRVWSCWANGAETWLFTCEMSLPLSRERGNPVLHVRLHTKDGVLKDADTWTTDPYGTWRRAAVADGR
jgi:hypothetical protein